MSGITDDGCAEYLLLISNNRDPSATTAEKIMCQPDEAVPFAEARAKKLCSMLHEKGKQVDGPPVQTNAGMGIQVFTIQSQGFCINLTLVAIDRARELTRSQVLEETRVFEEEFENLFGGLEAGR